MPMHDQDGDGQPLQPEQAQSLLDQLRAALRAQMRQVAEQNHDLRHRLETYPVLADYDDSEDILSLTLYDNNPTVDVAGINLTLRARLHTYEDKIVGLEIFGLLTNLRHT